MFEGKTALITGSTQGLGLAIARRLDSLGISGLIITGRDEARGRAVVESLSCKAHFIPADLSDMAQVSALADQALNQFGVIDHLVNSAAYTGRSTILDETADGFDFMFAVNVRAPYFLTQALARRLVERDRPGSMLSILSMSGLGGQSFLSSYAASKGALAVSIKNSAFSLLRNRIRINGLNIGWMDSDGETQVQKHWHDAPDDWVATAEANQPLGRLIKPDEVAKTVSFLLSDDSGMMTGSIIDFDQQVAGCADVQPHPLEKMRWPA